MAKNRVDTLLTPELYCSNIKVSVAFYTETLGFSIQYEREEEGFAMLEREGSRIMLDEIGKPAASVNRSWLSASLEFPFGRGVNFQIKTAAVDKLYEKVQKNSARIFLPIENKWYRAGNIEIGQRQFIVLDPDGYMLRFIEEIGTTDR
ncbi:MAG: VOC family protein [Legionellaceae bacterium]|nr:VOC family protein [Legionellaceae bacterium]MBP9776107.1 VOC family protein [Legionellaceae bacterium]